ncbi:hypothetical protein CB1_000932062 [Camelus ferus]|nr:hypothetical protein CB1_000932062 [Camelus ferus]
MPGKKPAQRHARNSVDVKDSSRLKLPLSELKGKHSTTGTIGEGRGKHLPRSHHRLLKQPPQKAQREQHGAALASEGPGPAQSWEEAFRSAALTSQSEV